MRVLILKSAVNFGRFAAAYEIGEGHQLLELFKGQGGIWKGVI